MNGLRVEKPPALRPSATFETGGLVPPSIIRAQWQPVIFADRPRRLLLQRLKADWPCRKVSISVHRNTPFEYVAQIMPPFLAYAGLEAEFAFGDYDDSLSFAGGDDANLHLVWLDFARFGEGLAGTVLVTWLAGRLRTLRGRTSAPILVSNWAAMSAEANAFNLALESAAAAIPGVRVYDHAALASSLGDAFHDQRLREVGATSMSGPAGLLTARDLGLRIFPATLAPHFKCICLDLDNTLYSGVLGEDGSDGLVLTEAYRVLQERLLKMREEGMLLAVLSKNELEDVHQLFKKRQDFPLKWEHFSATSVNWDSKVTGLRAIAEQLRIGLDAILLLDDNLGELAQVGAELPAVGTVYSYDPVETLAALDFAPGLLAWSHSDADRLRAADLTATWVRDAGLSAAVDPAAYLSSLETRLDFFRDQADQLGRLYQLSSKTNQFNLSLRRFDEAEVARWLDEADRHVVSFTLADRLSDSGIVGMLMMRPEADALLVEELCISCRALGRQLEDLMIGAAIDRVAADAGATAIAFAYATGPRNKPARSWLARFSGTPLDNGEGRVSMAWPPPGLTERLAAPSVRLIWR